MRLIVGLRNPGTSYAGTRHNVGAEVVTRFTSDYGARFKKAKRPIRADVAEIHVGGSHTVLALPRTFMNESGQAVAPLMRYYSAGPQDLLVVHDDIDLPFCKLRVSLDGGAGGHNGVQSVIASLDTKEFWRLKVGVGRPPVRMDPADFVLRRFGKVERPAVDAAVVRAIAVVEAFAADDGEAARRCAGESNAS